MSPVGGVEGGSPSPWVRPSEVMRARYKAKKRLLQARISATPLQVVLTPSSPSSSPFTTTTSTTTTAANTITTKRRNPFKSSPNKRPHSNTSTTSPGDEDTTDATLFHLFNPAHHNTTTTNLTPHAPTSFTNVLKDVDGVDNVAEREVHKTPWVDCLPLDWSLKSRLRFKCNKPLPWKHTFKTSEEASGTTGFVRCLGSGLGECASGEGGQRTLDTSANAQFYQRCLVWQSPTLPWLGTLFPRHFQQRPGGGGGGGGSSLHPRMVETLRTEWSESLRSLHQLLRVRQCAYFYVCAAGFTVLFRAAGVGGISQAHALITPTTSGFRQAMKEEDIEFEMPFHRSKNEEEEEEEEKEEKEAEQEDDAEEKREATSWLEDLGLETSQFPNLNPNRAKMERDRLADVDSRPSSLVYVEGMEIQALINFLINSKSCVALSGELAGVPPTLLAPTAFQGATLRTLKTKGGIVRDGSQTYNSMEISGPILPHTVHQLTGLLSQAVESFSLSLTRVSSSLPFTLHSHREATSAPQAFAEEGLVDCGLDSTTRQLLCAPTPTSRPLLPPTYREVTCQHGKYTWTDK